MRQWLTYVRSDIRYRGVSFSRWLEKWLKTAQLYRVVPLTLFFLALAVIVVPQLRGWANDNPGAMTAAAALVAAIFAAVTLDLVSQGREATYVAQEQYAVQTIPVIVFELMPGATLEAMTLKVSNIGLGPALNLRFQQRPPNMVLVDKMDEPSSTVPVIYNFQPGGDDSVLALRSGGELLLHLSASGEVEDAWTTVRQHVLYGGEHRTTYLGWVVAIYDYIGSHQEESIVDLEWHPESKSVVLSGTSVPHPNVRPQRVLGVDTQYWQTSPKNWIQYWWRLRERKRRGDL